MNSLLQFKYSTTTATRGVEFGAFVDIWRNINCWISLKEAIWL